MFPIVNMSTLTARSYKINKMPTQAFTPHASNEIWCRLETTAPHIKDLKCVGRTCMGVVVGYSQ